MYDKLPRSAESGHSTDPKLLEQFRAMDPDEIRERLDSGTLTVEATSAAEMVSREQAARAGNQESSFADTVQPPTKERKRNPVWFWLTLLLIGLVIKEVIGRFSLM